MIWQSTCSHYMILQSTCSHYIILQSTCSHYIILQSTCSHYIILQSTCSHYIILQSTCSHFVVNLQSLHDLFGTQPPTCSHHIILYSTCSHYIVLQSVSHQLVVIKLFCTQLVVITLFGSQPPNPTCCQFAVRPLGQAKSTLVNLQSILSTCSPTYLQSNLQSQSIKFVVRNIVLGITHSKNNIFAPFFLEIGCPKHSLHAHIDIMCPC